MPRPHKILAPRVALLIGVVLSACGSGDRELDPAATYDAYGVPFEPAGAVPAQALVAEAASYEDRAVMVEGVLLDSCKPGSCWMAMDAGSGKTIRVFLRQDASLSLPEQIEGRRAVVHGELSRSERTAEVDSSAVFDLSATGIMVERVRS